MKWLLNSRLRRLEWQRKRNGEVPAAARLRQARADFSGRWREIFSACEVLATLAQESPRQIAQRYMTRVLEREEDNAWWQENAPYLNQPWFIWQYSCAQGLATALPPAAEPPPLLLIRPKGTTRRDACVHLRLSRENADSNRGWLFVSGPEKEKSFQDRMHAQGLWPRNGHYVRRIGETAAPLIDRGVELAVLLLEEGYTVSVEEPVLEARILRRQFAPERRYWVLAPPQRDKLRLSYPRDQRLHQYVCKAGAIWNGRYMEISICHADRVEELMRLYGFDASAAAKRRLEIWHKAVDQATLYRERKKKNEPPGATPADMFKKMLTQKIDVIEDLLETDE